MDQENTRPDDQATTPGQGSDTPASTPDATDVPQDPYSRRRFLRAAVIGAAGVAGAAGAAGVVLAHGHLPSVVGLINPNPGISFQDPNCTACVTNSSFSQNVGDICGKPATGFNIGANGKANNPGDFYVFFTAPNLPAGIYYVYFAPDPDFATQGAQPYYRDVYPAGTAPCCPDHDPTALGADQVNSGDLTNVFPYTITPAAAPKDLVLQVHMDYIGGVIGSPGDTKTFTFTATFTNGLPAPVCAETVTIVGTQH
ncbi:MAG TPA: twin-arginine translocation signal domain-containing protein [Ktedonobacterales bacterium]|jgi:hypothetical protein